MSEARLHYRTCPLCEAMCGLTLEVRGDQVTAVRGDPDDPLSRGYLCPKGVGLMDVHDDPDRLRRPMRRRGDDWETISWHQAFEAAAAGLDRVRRRHGPDSVAFYSGNPNLHSYSAQLLELELTRALATRNCFSTASMDHLPHLMTSYHLFGHQLLLPVPDLDRTDFLLVIGANPVESNGSLMSAPGVARRLEALKDRGGRLVVIDPRRTKTARLADTHHFIRPGTDALLLLAMIHTLFNERLVQPGRLVDFTRGIDAVQHATEGFSPASVEERVGIPAAAIRALARDFADAPSAVCYGRIGACTQEFGTLACWLMQVVNVLTGNLDRPGGAMFPRPAADVVRVGALLGLKGSFDTYRSRVRGLPEFAGQLPVAALAEEIDTAGEGQVRALVTSAGNPVLSTPNGARLDRALPGLDFMVAIDIYLNETTRHADLILPPTFALERDHYDLGFRALAVRNSTRYTPALFDAGSDARHDWQIYAELAIRLDALGGGVGGLTGAMRGRLVRALSPRRLLDFMLRTGPYGSGYRPWSGLSVDRLERRLHTTDLGPLSSCLPQRLYTRPRRIELAPRPFLQDLERLTGGISAHSVSTHLSSASDLLLIGRRHLNDNNSWMHNVSRLMKGANRCTLQMHPRDAETRQLSTGQPVEVRSRVGCVVAPLEITELVMPGVVSLPHGYGHGRAGTRQPVADGHSGVSVNDITDEQRLDVLSGTVGFNGVPVTVTASAERP